MILSLVDAAHFELSAAAAVAGVVTLDDVDLAADRVDDPQDVMVAEHSAKRPAAHRSPRPAALDAGVLPNNPVPSASVLPAGSPQEVHDPVVGEPHHDCTCACWMADSR
jgi:hypothetical protein